MSGKIDVASTRDAVYIRVAGQGTMQNALPLKEFADRMAQEGYESFFVDLGPCDGMDSTFMGTLLGIALSTNRDEHLGVTVLNASRKNRDLLSTLGLTAILRLVDGDAKCPAGKLTPLQLEARDPKQRLGHIVAVHEKLVALNRENDRVFGPFIRAVREELKG